MKESWNVVIGDVATQMTSKIAEMDEQRGRPKSIGTAWRESYNETYAASVIYPTNLEYFGILGDPMLFVRDVYDEAAGVAEDSQAVLGVLASPSPFNGVVALRISGIRTGGGTVSIFDVRGRRVHRDVIGEAVQGVSIIEWNGVDSFGRSLPSGVYFARVENGGGSSVCRVVHLK